MSRYLVVLGDTALKIAIRCTGHPERHPQLTNTNVIRCEEGRFVIYPGVQLDLPKAWGKAPGKSRMLANAQNLLRKTAKQICSRDGMQSEPLDESMHLMNVCHEIIRECRS